MRQAAAGAGAYPIRPFNMKLVLKAVLVGSDPQPLTVGTHVERNRERLALYHAPRDARHASARRQQGAYFVRGDRYSSFPGVGGVGGLGGSQRGSEEVGGSRRVSEGVRRSRRESEGGRAM